MGYASSSFCSRCTALLCAATCTALGYSWHNCCAQLQCSTVAPRGWIMPPMVLSHHGWRPAALSNVGCSLRMQLSSGPARCSWSQSCSRRSTASPSRVRQTHSSCSAAHSAARPGPRRSPRTMDTPGVHCRGLVAQFVASTSKAWQQRCAQGMVCTDWPLLVLQVCDALYPKGAAMQSSGNWIFDFSQAWRSSSQCATWRFPALKHVT